MVRKIYAIWRFPVDIWENSRMWLSKRENLLFALLIVLHLLPVWLFKYFPSQDGPAHIYNSSVLREYFFPERSLFREYFVINHQLVPNWFIHSVLAGLMYVVPPLIAGKIVLSGYVILLPISLRYALSAIRPDTQFLSFLAFPFTYNYMLHMGFYNFSYSLPMFLFVVGYWLKHQKQFTWRNTLILGLLSLLLYFCHLISLVTACVAIAILTVWLVLFEIIYQNQQFHPRLIWRVFSHRVLMPLSAFLPTLILAALFALHKDKARVENNIYHVTVWKQALKLLSINSIASYNKLELLLSTALGVLFIALFAYFLTKKVSQRQINGWDGLLLLMSAYVVIYFIAPNAMLGGGQAVSINLRLIFYPFFILTLWLGAQSYQRLMKWKIKVIAAGIALMLLGVHTIKYAQINNYMKEYVSGMNAIEPNTTIIAHCLDSEKCLPERDLSWRVGSFTLASGYIATQRHLVDLTNYQAALEYFPIMFRPSLNPYKDPSKTSANNVIDYFQKIGRNVDYAIVWGSKSAQPEDESTKSLFRQLQQRYDLIYTSPQRGLMQIYRRQNSKRSHPG